MNTCWVESDLHERVWIIYAIAKWKDNFEKWKMKYRYNGMDKFLWAFRACWKKKLGQIDENKENEELSCGLKIKNA